MANCRQQQLVKPSLAPSASNDNKKAVQFNLPPSVPASLTLFSLFRRIISLFQCLLFTNARAEVKNCCFRFNCLPETTFRCVLVTIRWRVVVTFGNHAAGEEEEETEMATTFEQSSPSLVFLIRPFSRRFELPFCHLQRRWSSFQCSTHVLSPFLISLPCMTS